MNASKHVKGMLLNLLRLSLIALLWWPATAGAALEQTFDVLQVGTTTYRNVTVTTKDKKYVFLLHSNGMTSLKVADLPPALQIKLGYPDPAAPVVHTNSTAAWARTTLSKLEVPQVAQVRERLEGMLLPGKSGERNRFPPMSRNLVLMVGAVLLGLYLLHCYCCLLICRKAGAEPGPLVWVPILQLFPLLKAAGMAPWWFLVFLVPGLNLIAQVIWCLRIVRARGKGLLLALFLILPVTSPLAVLYLAFSGNTKSRKQERRVEIMTLEAA